MLSFSNRLGNRGEAGDGTSTNPTVNNFTPRAQQTLALARKEADRFNHKYVGTEHLLLGLVRLGQGVAVNVLQKMGANLETIRMEVEVQVGSGPERIMGNIPYTPRVKKVLAFAGKEARSLSHSYVGTEHLLLGLLREGEGVAARVLKNLNVDIARARHEVLKELDPNYTPPEASGDSGTVHRFPKSVGMSRLSEIKYAAEQLSAEEKRELIRYLTWRLRGAGAEAIRPRGLKKLASRIRRIFGGA
jgi:ATP-dependent Clp protease ATP-binding subunit ClpC